MYFIKLKQTIKKFIKEGTVTWEILHGVYRKINYIGIIKGSLGALPDFLIIGVQKGGTSSLYHYLIQHPDIFSAVDKEPWFFTSKRYNKGMSYYRSFFPFEIRKRLRKLRGIKFVTGEASTSYMIAPYTAIRVHKHLPNIKIIAILRNPIERAYSNYCHEVRQGVETFSFEEAIEKEKYRIKGEREKMLKNPTYPAYNYHKFCYVQRGFYYNDLKPWFSLFSKENILVLRSEDLFQKPEKTVNEVFNFLGLMKCRLKRYDVIQKGWNKSKMKTITRNKLRKIYEPYNEKLFKLIIKRFDWE